VVHLKGFSPYRLKYIFYIGCGLGLVHNWNNTLLKLKIMIGVVTRLHIGNDNITLDFPHTFENIHYKEFINKGLD
jgi:hypothetical protein